MTEVKFEIKKDGAIFPHFLSMDLENHRDSLYYFGTILDILIDVDYCAGFFDEEGLKAIAQSIKQIIDEVRLILDDRTFMKWIDWLRYRVYYYRQLYLKLEHYEQAANLERIFTKIFRKKHII